MNQMENTKRPVSNDVVEQAKGLLKLAELKPQMEAIGEATAIFLVNLIKNGVDGKDAVEIAKNLSMLMLGKLWSEK